MKSKDIQALHQQSLDQLKTKLNELTDQLAKIRLEKSAGRLENTSSVKNLADDVARIKTVISVKQLQEINQVAAPTEKTEK